MRSLFRVVITGSTVALLAAIVSAQGTPTGGPGGTPQGQGRAGGGGGGATFPAQQRALADQATLDRGKTLFGINCASCHGVDARGGDQGGPNLLRSQILLTDLHGELIIPIVHGGRAANGMDPINMPDADVVAVAEYLHALAAAGRGRGNAAALNVLVGDGAAGQAAFATRCASCHSAAGDLKGIATRIPDPTTLQNFWISGGRGAGRGGGGAGGAAPAALNPKPTTVTVTPVSGAKVEGQLVRIDDFLVTLIDANGINRTFVRNGEVPKVEVHDPLEAHIQLLPKYTDKEIHDITAYLATIK